MSRILYVHYEDGTIQTFGVPDGWQVPPPFRLMEDWLTLPTREGETASISFRLRDVKWMSAADEREVELRSL